MRHFSPNAQNKNRWLPGTTFPDQEFGHLYLAPGSGHPGSDRATVMQWTSPFLQERLKISGVLKRPSERGNGVRALIISSRSGVLLDRQIKPTESLDMPLEIEVKDGETLSFVVDCMGSTDSDSYQWAPQIERIHEDGTLAIITKADLDFCGADGWPLNRTKPQTPLAQLAQVLLMSNEFQFLD
jgi:hypothetical protein